MQAKPLVHLHATFNEFGVFPLDQISLILWHKFQDMNAHQLLARHPVKATCLLIDIQYVPIE